MNFGENMKISAIIIIILVSIIFIMMIVAYYICNKIHYKKLGQNRKEFENDLLELNNIKVVNNQIAKADVEKAIQIIVAAKKPTLSKEEKEILIELDDLIAPNNIVNESVWNFFYDKNSEELVCATEPSNSREYDMWSDCTDKHKIFDFCGVRPKSLMKPYLKECNDLPFAIVTLLSHELEKIRKQIKKCKAKRN